MSQGRIAFGIRILFAVFFVVFSGCAPILSERTDEQEWIRYRAETNEVARNPASLEGASLEQIILEASTDERAFRQIQAFYQSLLSGVEISGREHVRALLHSCGFSESKNDGEEVEDCVRQKAPLDMEHLLNLTTDRLGLVIVSRKAREWVLTHQIAPIYEKELERARKRSPLASSP